MHAIPWYIALLISVPQTILIIQFGFRLFNIQLKTRDVILLAVIISGLCYLLRPLAIPYAVNTFMLIVFLSLLSFLICNINLRYCFISVVLGVIICGVAESILLPLIMKVLKISLDNIIVNPWINLIAYVPIFLITTLLLIYVVTEDLVLYDFGSELHEV